MNTDAPGVLLASLPAALGREPAEEALLVSPVAGGALIATVPLPASEQEPMLLPACLAAVDYARSAGCRTVVVVTYADSADADPVAAQAAATLVVAAEQRGLTVLDTLRVTGSRWWSYECDNPSCCPPEGTPIPTPEETTP